jgi:manganese oxidase
MTDESKVRPVSRRSVLGSAAALIGAGMVSGRAQAASIPEAPTMADAKTQKPLAPKSGRPYQPVVTLNGWTLPSRMNGEWKEFHLVAEPVVREVAPGMVAHLWGYNGQSPGPTIEAVEGDKVRIFVTNKLPEHTTIHWHGQLLPNGMDGVGGLTQPHIKPGKTFVYEFQLKKSGTFMYHPHADEMVQMAMGMMGFFVVHPRDPNFMRVDRDFVFLLSSYDIDPGSYVPRVSEMTDFNIWTFNTRVFPGIDPIVVRKNDRARIRVGNLTMTNHPVHMHGYDFSVTCTDGGWVRPEARWPEVTIDIPVGAMRAFEFDATYEGDWAIHCHKSHHTMNPMGHEVSNFIGVEKKDIAKKIRQLVPDYMAMGSAGMADMSEMEMPLPDNTLPMMTGTGPFGPIEMGGMFTVVKVRDGLSREDYGDPGWFKHPPGTVAYEWQGENQASSRVPSAARSGASSTEFQVIKPGSNKHNNH